MLSQHSIVIRNQLTINSRNRSLALTYFPLSCSSPALHTKQGRFHFFLQLATFQWQLPFSDELNFSCDPLMFLKDIHHKVSGCELQSQQNLACTYPSHWLKVCAWWCSPTRVIGYVPLTLSLDRGACVRMALENVPGYYPWERKKKLLNN